MRKRLHKKLCTSKSYGITRGVTMEQFKNVKVKRALIKEGKITVKRVDLSCRYEDLKL